MTDPSRPQFPPPSGSPVPPASAAPAAQPHAGAPAPQAVAPGAGIGRTALVLVGVALLLELLFSVLQALVISGPDGFQAIPALSIARTALLLVLTLTAGALAAVALARKGAPRTAPSLALGAAAALLLGVLSGLLYSGTFALLAG
ncbi:MAG: hypothetical protein ABW204_05685 [Microbacteriaceae bacterium]